MEASSTVYEGANDNNNAEQMSEHLLEVYATIGFTFVQGLFTNPDSVIAEVREIADQIRAANADPLQSIRDEIAALKGELGIKEKSVDAAAVDAAADAAVADPAPTPDDVKADAVETVKKKIFSPRGQNGIKGGGRSLRQFMGIAE